MIVMSGELVQCGRGESEAKFLPMARLFSGSEVKSIALIALVSTLKYCTNDTN